MKSDLTVEIDGTKYIIRSMTTSVGARTLLQLGRLLLPTIKPIATLFDLNHEVFNLLDKPFNMEDVL